MKYIFIISFVIGLYTETLHAKNNKPKWTLFSDLKVVKAIEKSDEKVPVGDWICSIGPIKTDKFGNESRRFGCSVDEKREVYVNPICSYSKKHGRFIGSDTGFNLQMKHEASIFVSLNCSESL